MADAFETFVPYEERIERPQGETSPRLVAPLPDSFGRSLDTLERARQWLTNPHNWHESRLFIIKWNGLLPTISREHGMRLQREWWDNGLPWCVVFEQRKRRSKSERGESMEDPDPANQREPSDEPSVES